MVTIMIYDLAIIGGGPAGVAAGVYASRKKLRTLFITKDFASQSTVSESIENWIGTTRIAGLDLAKNLEAHLREYAGDVVDIAVGQNVTALSKTAEIFTITTEKGATYQASTVLVATGSHRRKLDVPGATQFEHKGITYCASCDGPLFSAQNVAVIGGGNAAFESAAQLAAYCKHVTIIQRGSEYRADPVTVSRVLSTPNVTGITNTEINEVRGDTFVNSIVFTKKETGEQVVLPVAGIFVEIGLIPTTYFVKGLADMDQTNHIKVNPRTQETSCKGLWAAGDCTDGLYHQNNIAAGDAVKALEDIYLSLKAR
jgi:alkyl hydroperoxide reductase subunit F